MPDGTKGGYPKEWEGKTMGELANEDGTIGKLHSTKDEVGLNIFVREAVLEAVVNECNKQICKWGVQSHPSFRLTPSDVTGYKPVIPVDDNWLPHENDAKARCEVMHSMGLGTWSDILLEELAEANEAAQLNEDATGASIKYPVNEWPETKEGEAELVAWLEESGADDVYKEVVQMVAVGVSWLTDMTMAKRKDGWQKEYEEHKAQIEAQRAFYRNLQQQVQTMLQPGQRAPEAVEGDFEIGGYI